MNGTVIVISKPTLGHVGPIDRGFGIEMLGKFLHAMEGADPKPRAICFYTEGVGVACEGSPALLTLQLLEKMGVTMVICKTCLDHYRMTEERAVGEAVGMDQIVALMSEADRVLYP